MNNITASQTRDNGIDAPTSTSRRKGVTFHPTARMRFTIAVNDFTEKEFQAYWYSTEEIQKSREEIYETISLLNLNIDLDNDHYCEHDLETLVGYLRQVKLQRRRIAADIVLRNQQEENSVDKNQEEEHPCTLQEKIAEEYSMCCKSSNAIAYILGVANAYEARTYCYRTGRRRTPSSFCTNKWY